jgi:general secretion pathway protein H
LEGYWNVKNRGFSLLETIAVLVLLSLSIALLAPSLSRFSKAVELKAAVKKISAILRYCRSEAVNRGQVYQISFDKDLREVRVKSIDSANSSPKTYVFPEGINLKEVDVESPEYDSDFPAIEFYPGGGSNGGTIVLDSQGGAGYKIKVHFLTGSVEIEKG